MKNLLILVFLATMSFASTYSIKYKGITLGKIDTLETLKDNYLKARVTNSIVRFMMRKDYFIFYDGEKPKSKKTKYKHDSKKILLALKTAMDEMPYHETIEIDKKRKIILKCQQKDSCTFDYFSNGSHNASGTIEFQDGKFYKLVEKKSSLVIVLNK